MNDLDKITKWVEDGKQIGKVFSFIFEEKTIWSSVGLQKWKGFYKIYIDEIAEDDMASENYLKNETNKFEKLSDAIKYINEKSKINATELQPCKGQKIFNPDFM